MGGKNPFKCFQPQSFPKAFHKEKNVWKLSAYIQAMCPKIYLLYIAVLGTLQDEEHYIQPVFLSKEPLWIKTSLSRMYPT